MVYRLLFTILACVSFANADETQKPIRLPVIDNVPPVQVTPPQPKPVTVRCGTRLYRATPL